jgi:hypothetical protein
MQMLRRLGSPRTHSDAIACCGVWCCLQVFMLCAEDVLDRQTLKRILDR